MKKCLCLRTISLIVASWKFDVLKTSIFAFEASLLGQILFYEHQISAGQQSAFSSLTEIIYCLNSEAISLETKLFSTRYKPRVNYK